MKRRNRPPQHRQLLNAWHRCYKILTPTQFLVLADMIEHAEDATTTLRERSRRTHVSFTSVRAAQEILAALNLVTLHPRMTEAARLHSGRPSLCAQPTLAALKLFNRQPRVGRPQKS